MKTLITKAPFRQTLMRAIFGCTVLAGVMHQAQAGRPANTFPISNGTWTHVASACAPDEGSAPANLDGAGVFFADLSSTEMTLRCNVINVMDPDFSWDTLEVVYRDTDGPASAAQVTASLHRVGLNGASEAMTVVLDPVTGKPKSIFDSSLIATFDSNNVAVASSSPQFHTVSFAHTFDFGNNAYYVKLKIKRSAGSTAGVSAFVIRLYRSFVIWG